LDTQDHGKFAVITGPSTSCLLFLVERPENSKYDNDGRQELQNQSRQSTGARKEHSKENVNGQATTASTPSQSHFYDFPFLQGDG